VNQTYEDLVGGAGRSVFFRSRRFRTQSLVGELPAAVEVDGQRANLYDLSMTGLAFHVRETGTVPEVGAVVPLRVVLRDTTAFMGRGQVVRTEREPRRIKVGIRLVDALVDPMKIRELHDRLIVEEAISCGTDAFARVPVAYKQLCSDAAFFLNYWRTTLDRWEDRTARDRRSGDVSDEIELHAEARMRREWTKLRERGNELTRGIDVGDPIYFAAKRFTEIQLTPHFLRGSIWDRAYRKPLGYPGDYVLMNYMYDQERLGDTAFARILHQLGREERLAATVPSRNELVLRHIRATASEHATDPAHSAFITSIGAGPAREIENFLKSAAPRGRISICLIDQDENALAFASERLRRAALAHGDLVEVKYRYISFRQLMTRPDVLGELKGQHLIYSAGLADYLSDQVARELIRQCFELVAPGGSLLVGNAAMGPDVRWVPEFVLDWHMLYRSEAMLRGLAQNLETAAEIVVDRDRSEAWHFLNLRKRAPGGPD
jgi:extracellular factor (EF) 3-hydroxypalmitic acid methyl ester biosynthesis protein